MSRKHGWPFGRFKTLDAAKRTTRTKLAPSNSIHLEPSIKSDGAFRVSNGGAEEDIEPDMEDRWDGSRDRWEDEHG